MKCGGMGLKLVRWCISLEGWEGREKETRVGWEMHVILDSPTFASEIVFGKLENLDETFTKECLLPSSSEIISRRKWRKVLDSGWLGILPWRSVILCVRWSFRVRMKQSLPDFPPKSKDCWCDSTTMRFRNRITWRPAQDLVERQGRTFPLETGEGQNVYRWEINLLFYLIFFLNFLFIFIKSV